MGRFKEVTALQLRPGTPIRKWLIFAFALIISAGSIIYTNMLVKQIDERERKQIERYASALEYLANDPNVILLLQDIVLSNTTIPVILTDNNENPTEYRNLPIADKETDPVKRTRYLQKVLDEMKGEHEPIQITQQESDVVIGKIFYKNSILLSQLSYYPYVQLTIIAVFVLVAFLLFNDSRVSEQNRVWVGLAKETAHQLGTPLSSLMAWSEYFKSTYPDQMEILKEFDKDVKSLETITERFSNIGSTPKLNKENVTHTISEIVSYLGTRLSTKIKLTVQAFPNDNIHADLNKSLFAWVIENLLKNAADAMGGRGSIDIRILKVNEGIAIDISDTGKGMSKSKMSQIFRPGFTTKKRGWGLGLALAKRIIENYHQGKIYVKSSEINVGTTFRILLND